MCVIAVVEDVRLTSEQVEQMWIANPQGGGVAWREAVDGQPVVKWRKGLIKEEMVKLNLSLPMPYVLHFRVASPNTSKSLYANHPFIISDQAEFDFEGTTGNYALFHNGFWNDWRNKVQAIAISGFVPIPNGPWSDSRGLAWSAWHMGLGILEMINEKVVAIGPGDEDLEYYGDWYKIFNEDAEGKKQRIYVSNLGWEKVTLPLVEQSRGTAPAGQSFCPPRLICAKDESTTPVEIREENRQQRVQATDASVTGSKVVDLNQQTRKCTAGGCGKITPSGAELNGLFYCWQCWSKQSQSVLGMCETCKVQWASCRTNLDNKWICAECHQTNGRPRLAYFHGGLHDSVN